ncbi:MAG: hypothetical protein IPP47_14015 [Bryobacterales bacterium]|nr:hypothetical protein [Bryobacterales bacterium]
MKETILPVNLERREGLELESLRRTRAALRAKTVNVALAVFFTTLVFSATSVRHPLVEMIQAGGMWVATALLAAGAYFWWRFVQACRDLRGTGLPPERGIWPRLAWLAGGALIGEAASALAHGWRDTNSQFPIFPVGGFAAVWLGEKLRQVMPVSEVKTVQTLFPAPDDEEKQ